MEMKAPPHSKEDETLHNYLTSLPPLETNEDAGATLNSLAFDFSPTTSYDNVLFNILYDESIVPIRNNPLDTSMPKLFSEDAKKIHPHEEADNVIPTEDYSPDLSLISSDGFMKDSVEGGNCIQEVGQVEANSELPDCENQIQRWNDEVFRTQELVLDRLENRMTINVAKSDEQNASNQISRSSLIMPFQDLTNKQLNPPNLKRKMNDQIHLDASFLTHENQEESADFYQRPCSCQNCLNNHINEDKVLEARKKIVPKVVRSSDYSPQINKSGCNCNKTSCMKKYCECYKAGVGCSPSCNCRGCENIHGRKDGVAGTKS
ncbi:hypothetical protein KIW84_065568 [Lathyrus oleraceus]|uniref:CRC domain-containing protein n=1 Tax=Pisum sativum TaxID=3888 RepID=A0A9D4WDE9_PEA|nr:hypothetical protein KIW84_065568 [Pisum sativum]